MGGRTYDFNGSKSFFMVFGVVVAKAEFNLGLF
jgi:hypothetical protein